MIHRIGPNLEDDSSSAYLGGLSEVLAQGHARRVRGMITSIVTEKALVELDREGSVTEVIEVYDQIRRDDIDIEFVDSVLSVYP